LLNVVRRQPAAQFEKGSRLDICHARAVLEDRYCSVDCFLDLSAELFRIADARPPNVLDECFGR